MPQVVLIVIGSLLTFFISLLMAIGIVSFRDFPPKDLYDKLCAVFIFSAIFIILSLAAAVLIGGIVNE